MALEAQHIKRNMKHHETLQLVRRTREKGASQVVREAELRLSSGFSAGVARLQLHPVVSAVVNSPRKNHVMDRWKCF